MSNDDRRYSEFAQGDVLELSRFEFDRGDDFVRWHWTRDDREPSREDVWRVIHRSFRYRVGYDPGREDIPRAEHHRQYQLMNAHTWDKVRVNEWELSTEWERIGNRIGPTELENLGEVVGEQ